MKKRITVFLTVCLIAFSLNITASASVDVSAQSAVLMCADTGEILFSRNADKQLSMASTTKIMTSLLALEAAMPDAEITVTKEMVSIEGTSMGLMVGDSVSLKELVYGMLLQSGNDAANTVAYFLSGSPENFAKLMNERAEEIGMKNSNFVTASGLDSENHYSTAYDMALLACESIKNPEFVSICSQKTAKLTYGNPPYPRTLTNHNKLLWKYEDTIGIKTGFTKKSGRCLVSAAERDGVTLVAVTLNAPNDWNDHISMFEYGFSRCKGVELSCELSNVRLNVYGGVKETASVELYGNVCWLEGETAYVRLLINPVNYAPLKKGDIVGTAVFITADNRVIDEIPICVSEDVSAKETVAVRQKSEESFFSEFIRSIKEFFRGEIIGR